jgi:outer membrane protein assembly factor BamB
VVTAAPAATTLALVPTRDLWTLALNNPITAPPATDGERVFFSIEGGRLVAYEIASGKQLWLIESQPAREPSAGGGLVFVAADAVVTARHASDGSVAWTQALDEPPALPPVWDNGWLLLTGASGRIHALRAHDGHQIWQRDVGAVHARPALGGDRVYLALANGHLAALQVETGATVWDRRVGGMPNDVLALDDRIYFGATDGYFYCLLTRDGAIDWRWRTGGNVIGRPVADERNVFFISLDNVLRALDRTSGGQRWMKPLPIRPSSGPVKAGTTLVISGLYPALRTFATKDGAAGTDLSAGGGEVIALPLVFNAPMTGLPMLLVVTRDIAKGATAVLSVRSMDPAIMPIAPLPNAVMPAPTLSIPQPAVGSAYAPDAVPHVVRKE